MNPVALAVLKTGLISKEMRAQFERWGAPTFAEIPDLPVESAEQVVQMLSFALESEGYVLTKVTDLDVIREFYTTQQEGALHLTVNGISDILPVLFGRTALGEIILPWRADSIDAAMIDPDTYLDVTANRDTGVISRTYFKDVREVFFGDVKAFMLCAISETKEIQEKGHGHD